jgi:SAM-dependent methyltransferase
MLRTLYRTLVPEALRASPAVQSLKTRLLGHDRVYDADYYARTVEGPAARSAPTMAATIVEELRPASVIDVGCGTGALLSELRRRGCDVEGLEHSRAGLAYCRGRALSVRKFDLLPARFAASTSR